MLSKRFLFVGSAWVVVILWNFLSFNPASFTVLMMLIAGSVGYTVGYNDHGDEDVERRSREFWANDKP